MTDRLAKILVVDDDSVSRLVISHIIAKAGHDVLTAESAENARQQIDGAHAARSGIDLIVCDYLMPDESGLDLLASLDSSTRPPFVLLTGVGDRAKFDDERIDDVTDFLTKPVESDELTAVIERCLQAAPSIPR